MARYPPRTASCAADLSKRIPVFSLNGWRCRGERSRRERWTPSRSAITVFRCSAPSSDLRTPQSPAEQVQKSGQAGRRGAERHGRGTHSARRAERITLAEMVSSIGRWASVIRLWTRRTERCRRGPRGPHASAKRSIRRWPNRPCDTQDRRSKVFLAVLSHDLRTPLGHHDVIEIHAQLDELKERTSRSPAHPAFATRERIVTALDFTEPAGRNSNRARPSIWRSLREQAIEGARRVSKRLRLTAVGDLFGQWDAAHQSGAREPARQRGAAWRAAIADHPDHPRRKDDVVLTAQSGDSGVELADCLAR